MARKAPTAEQKAKAAERRARFAELARTVSEMTEDARAELVHRVGAIVTVEGRALSVHNSCLVLTQLPPASMVGGFRQWLAHGRCVRKGEHGLMIWVPTGRDKSGESGEPEPTAPEGTEDAKGKRSGFIMGTVFDVSQTDPTDDGSTDAEEGTEPTARPECRQCGCTGESPTRCDVCGAALVPC